MTMAYNEALDQWQVTMSEVLPTIGTPPAYPLTYAIPIKITTTAEDGATPLTDVSTTWNVKYSCFSSISLVTNPNTHTIYYQIGQGDKIIEWPVYALEPDLCPPLGVPL